MNVTCQNCKRELQMPQCAPGTTLMCPHCKQWMHMGAAPIERWFVAWGKQKVGPFSVEQLKQQASAGKLRPGDMLLKEGTAKWVAASEIYNLFLHASAQSPPVRQPASVAGGSGEVVYFQNDRTLITSTRALINNVTYAMANVTSVRMLKIDPNATGVLLLILVGLLFAVVSVFSVGAEAPGCLLLSAAAGLLCFVLALLHALSLKTRWFVVLGSASGETRALWSHDRSLIQTIVDAITKSIINRG